MVLAGLIAYSAALIGLGVFIGSRVRGTDGFFVAGRTLTPLLLFATLLAANLGAASTMGAAALGYRDGLAAWWWVGSAGVGTLVLAWWVGPRIWAIAKEHGHLTVGDYLESRYGASVRALVAGLLWLATLAILSGQLIGMAEILEVVTGAPRWLGAVAGGVIVTIYFAAGGLSSSAWVNLVQLVVMLAGFTLAVPVALGAAGGWEAVVASAPTDAPDWTNFWSGGRSGWIYLALLGPAFIVSPGILQKVYGAADARAVRIGLTAAAVVMLLFAAAPPILGMVARYYAPDLASADQALPTVLLAALPASLGMLALAAVLSAEISSADAVLFMLSTSLAKDVYKRFVAPDATDAQVLRMARLGAVLAGIIGVLLATVLPSIIASLSIFYSVLSVTLFVPVVAGLHARAPGMPEAAASILAGVAALAAVRILGPVDRPALADPTLIGIGVSAVAFVAVLALRRSRLAKAPREN